MIRRIIAALVVLAALAAVPMASGHARQHHLRVVPHTQSCSVTNTYKPEISGLQNQNVRAHASGQCNFPWHMKFVMLAKVGGVWDLWDEDCGIGQSCHSAWALPVGWPVAAGHTADSGFAVFGPGWGSQAPPCQFDFKALVKWQNNTDATVHSENSPVLSATC